MPALTALLHTNNDALRLGRCLETLYPCDHILIVDHHSQDATVRIALEYGAQVTNVSSGTSVDHYAQSAAPGWILALDPRESLTEGLAATLFELKSEWKQHPVAHPAYTLAGQRSSRKHNPIDLPSLVMRMGSQNKQAESNLVWLLNGREVGRVPAMPSVSSVRRGYREGSARFPS